MEYDIWNTKLIAKNKVLKCAIRKEYKTNRAIFDYSIENMTGQKGDSCSYDLLSEVGEFRQAIFKSMLVESGYTLAIFESESEYYNILVENK